MPFKLSRIVSNLFYKELEPRFYTPWHAVQEEINPSLCYNA